MPRIARKDLNTPFLHVMIQGVNKEYIFENKKFVEKYLDIFNKNKNDYNFTLIAYCMMSNHAHFLVYTEDINEFGKFMQKTNLIYAQMYNREKNRFGVLFRNRYQTEPIYEIKYLINCIKYIHNNPVNAGMVSRCEDYKYSSYTDYINNKGLTQSKIMKDIFGSKCDYAKIFKNAYDKRFMDIEEKNSEEIKKYLIEGIREYKKKYNTTLTNVLSNREKLKEMIFFLKKNCKISYREIQAFFEISNGTMEGLKRNKY